MESTKFTLSLLANLPFKEGFSLDELVIEAKRMFEEEGRAGLINVIVALLDYVVCPPMIGKWSLRYCNIFLIK